MANKLAGKVAIITGAGSGIGLATAKLFAKEGAKVVLADFNQDTVTKATADLKASGAEAADVVVDVANEEQVNNMVQTAVDHFGKLDILINNAGKMDKMAPIANLDDDTWNKVLAVDLTGPMLASRAAVKVMLKQGHGGSIVHVASVAALRGGMAGAAYCAAKSGVLGLSRNIAVNYINQHIRSNVVAPGGVKTNIGNTMTDIDPDGIKMLQKTVSVKSTTAEPEQIANPLLFLASDDSNYISGQVLAADVAGIMIG